MATGPRSGQRDSFIAEETASLERRTAINLSSGTCRVYRLNLARAVSALCGIRFGENVAVLRPAFGAPAKNT